MARFCAVVTATDPPAEIAGMGGYPLAHGPHWAFGSLATERPGQPLDALTAGHLRAVGEVTLFNRAELLAALQAGPWAPPPAASDASVLLHWYGQAGADGLRRARGLFALAIWDKRQLVLARDAVGGRTLFYAATAACWAAASSLRALRRWPRLPTRLNLAAVRSFLTFAYLPGAETLLEGVHELLPGTTLTLPWPPTGALPTPVGYWEPSEDLGDPSLPVAHYASVLRQRLERAVADRLPAGEPVGVLLSGGLDSSLVTALACRLHTAPVTTYSIHFGPTLPNELAYSDLVAAHCRTRHRRLQFDGHQIAAHLAEAVALLDCPVGDPLTVPNLLLARAAAADGHRVILNGEGGDPVFGGPKNLPMLVAEWHRSGADPHERATTYLASYRKCYDQLDRLLHPAIRDALRSAPPLERLVEPYLHAPTMTSLLNRLLYTNLRTKGAHHILTKVERLTAAAGLEGRAPLFDEAVVAAAFATPPIYKLHGTIEKYVLKEAVRDLLPATIIDRPKSGMRVPVQHWLRGPLRTLANDLVLSPRARARQLFAPAVISEWVAGRGLLWPRHGGSLWLVLTLELWLRAFLDQPTASPGAPVDSPQPRRRSQPLSHAR